MTLAESNPSPLAAGTAEATAALRAAGARDQRVRNPDYLAAAFVSLRPKLTALVKVPGARRLVPSIAERILPGGYWFETARVRHMDAILWSELERGLAQLVILGAGFDTRAYRFTEQLRAARVYEVDHPATARRKRERVARVLGAPPPNVSYLDTDFTRDDIAPRLTANGYDTAQPTLTSCRVSPLTCPSRPSTGCSRSRAPTAHRTRRSSSAICSRRWLPAATPPRRRQATRAPTRPRRTPALRDSQRRRRRRCRAPRSDPRQRPWPARARRPPPPPRERCDRRTAVWLRRDRARARPMARPSDAW